MATEPPRDTTEPPRDTTDPPRDTTDPSGGNLCPTCSVIPFNDERLASFIVTQDRREPCWDTISAAELYPPKFEWYIPTVIDGRYPVDYRVVDFLPTLPCLEQSALRGCDFCSLLRLEIVQAGFDYTGFVEITLVYRLGPKDFPTLGLAALVAQLTWRPDIPSIPPASLAPDILHDCIIFTLESDNGKLPGRARQKQLFVSISLISPRNFPAEVASWLKIPRLRGEAPLSQENIQFMTDALADCVLNCNHYIATDFLPSRLLDLGPQTSLDCIRLVDSSQIVQKDGGDRPRYAALSYCWGSSLATDGAEQLRAKVDSMESMRQHVPEQGISRVILDAIKVCKALSIQYLWVDSLCIIQDEISDWETESASMTLIYSNAFVTISTPLASASNEGFLVRHRKQVAIPFQSRVVPSINGNYNLVASGTCHEGRLFGWPGLDIRGTSWESRGWTFQEYEMSNRLLIFGKSMVHFQCRYVVSENGYRQETSCLLPRRVETLDHSHLDLENSRLRWEWILNCYGDRLFTFDEDRLPGISGMAKYTADKTGDEYLAGLWKTDLPTSLVWYAHLSHNSKHHVEFPDLLDSLRSPKPYIAPSWSPLRLGVSVGKGTFQVYYCPLSAECTVVDASVISVGKNPFGRVQHGRIRIRGRTMPVLSDLAQLRCYKDFYLRYTRGKGAIIYCQLDWVPAGEICNRGELLMLLIASTEARESDHTRVHGGSLEAAQNCCKNGLDESAESRFTSSKSQAEQHNEEAEIEGGPLWSTELAVARSSEEVDTEGHRKTGPDVEDKSIQSEPGPDEFCTGSENGSWTSSANNRDASGLLIHHLSGTDTYVRVGVWTSMVEDGGGTAFFEDTNEQEIDIV